jgi:hypothetical protein
VTAVTTDMSVDTPRMGGSTRVDLPEPPDGPCQLTVSTDTAAVQRRLRTDRLGAAAMLLATLFVAVTAFRLAYAGSKGAALDAGLSAADAAWYPLCIEGVLVVAAVATALLGGPYPWAVLIGFSGLSIGANIMHAVDQPGPADWFMLLVAAVPPFALPLCVELTIRTVRRPAHKVAHEPRGDGVGAAHHSSSEPGLTGHEPRPLALVSPVREPHEPVAHEQHEPPGEPPTRRGVSPASSGSRRRQTSAAALPCDCGCGAWVSRATRTRHRRKSRPADQ